MNARVKNPVVTSAVSRGRGIHVLGIGLLVLATVTAAALAASRSHARAEESQVREAVAAQGVKVLVASAVAAPLTTTLELQGDVQPFRHATLYAKVSGYLQNLGVDRGDLVKANQILGVIESPETAQQELSAKAQLVLSERTEERARTLSARGLVSQQEMDTATSTRDVARADVQRIGALRFYEVLRAPFAGRITERYVDPGALLSAATGSTQSAQPVLDVADLTKVRVFVYPGQADAARAHEGDSVTFWTDADPSRKREAKIIRMTHALDPRTRTMLAEFDVDNADDSLRAGSFVHVRLTLPAGAAVIVPAEALVIRAGAPQIAVVKEGHAHFVAVDVIGDDGKQVRVASGASAGDSVILHPSDDVVEAAVVSVVAPKPAAAAAAK